MYLFLFADFNKNFTVKIKIFFFINKVSFTSAAGDVFNEAINAF